MALTVRELIEKLEKVENKTSDVYLEFPGEFLSVDTVLLDNEGDVTLVSDISSCHCTCQQCIISETKL